MIQGGCSLPQGLLLPDPPPSESGTSRGPSSVSLGAEGQSARGPRSVIWPGTDSNVKSQAGNQPDKNAPLVPLAEAGRDGITLNLVDATIADAAKAILGDILKVNYIIDSRVKGSVTVQTTHPVQRDALLDILDATLSAEGARVVVDKDLYKIVPANEAAAAGARLRVKGDGRRAGPGVSVHVVPLTYVAAAEMERVLKSVAPQSAILRVDTARNLLMLSGTPAEIAAINEVIEVFDVDWMRGMSFAVFPVEGADPDVIAQELSTMFGNDVDSPIKGVVRFIPNKRLRAVLAISPRHEYLTRAAAWLKRVEGLAQANQRQLYSYQVRNRPAAELAQLLLRVYSGGDRLRTPGTSLTIQRQTGGGVDGLGGTETRATAEVTTPVGSTTGTATPGAATPGAATLVDPTRQGGAGTQAAQSTIGEGESSLARPPGAVLPGDDRTAARTAAISVVADEPNRLLLITATQDEYRRILRILDRIDLLPDQVLLEATVAEVTLNNELRMGLRWFFEFKKNQLTLTDSLVGAVAPTFPGFAYFFNSVNVQVALDALSAVTDVNIVSSPTLTVLDGKRAVLQVGDEVPIVTQQATAVITPGAPIVNSVTYKNTGVILSIIPRINERGRVLLEIEQEVSAVSATNTSTIDSPTIQQRRVKTTVTVRDGESLVLGGLMQDKTSLGKTQMPILGEIPVVGNIFKQKDDTINRTELVIIITPRVMRDVNQVRLITDEFRDKLNLKLRPQRQGPPGRREELERIAR